MGINTCKHLRQTCTTLKLSNLQLLDSSYRESFEQKHFPKNPLLSVNSGCTWISPVGFLPFPHLSFSSSLLLLAPFPLFFLLHLKISSHLLRISCLQFGKTDFCLNFLKLISSHRRKYYFIQAFALRSSQRADKLSSEVARWVGVSLSVRAHRERQSWPRAALVTLLRGAKARGRQK